LRLVEKSNWTDVGIVQLLGASSGETADRALQEIQDAAVELREPFHHWRPAGDN